MLYHFQSIVGPDVFMHQALAEHLLGLVGKSPQTQGVLTVDELPAARHAVQNGSDDHLRLPLLTLMAESEAGGRAVCWGL